MGFHYPYEVTVLGGHDLDEPYGHGIDAADAIGVAVDLADTHDRAFEVTAPNGQVIAIVEPQP